MVSTKASAVIAPRPDVSFSAPPPVAPSPRPGPPPGPAVRSVVPTRSTAPGCPAAVARSTAAATTRGTALALACSTAPACAPCPSFSATARSWFFTRVRICTSRCRWSTRCRTSRSDAGPTQTRNFSNGPLHNSCSRCSASRASVFCWRGAAARIAAGFPHHNSYPSSARKRSNQRACPLASIPTRTA